MSNTAQDSPLDKHELLERMTAFILRSPEAWDEFYQWSLRAYPVPDRGPLAAYRQAMTEAEGAIAAINAELAKLPTIGTITLGDGT